MIHNVCTSLISLNVIFIFDLVCIITVRHFTTLYLGTPLEQIFMNGKSPHLLPLLRYPVRFRYTYVLI